MKKYLNVFKIVLFCAILVLPNVFFNFKRSTSYIDNKKLANLPKIYVDEKTLNHHFLKEFEEYYNDRIGFRELNIGLLMILEDKVFHVLNSPDFMWGKDNELYYGSDWAVNIYSGKMKFSEEKLKNEKENFEILDSYLRDKGIKNRVFTFIPSKEQIYFNNYPDSISRAKISMVDELCRCLENNSKLNILNLQHVLLDNKKEDTLLYYKIYDPFHWNHNGAFIAFSAIMERFKKKDFSLKSLTKDDFEIKQSEFKGLTQRYGNIKWLNDSFNYKEKLDRYEIKVKNNISSDPTFISDLGFDKKYKSIPYNYFHNDDLHNNKKIIILGDSYISSFMFDWFAHCFEEVHFLHSSVSMDVLDALIIKVKPQFFLFERVDRVGFSFNSLKQLRKNIFNPYSFSGYKMGKERFPHAIDKLESAARGGSRIVGWAYHDNDDCDVYMGIGGKYYKAEKTQRQDIQKAFNLKTSDLGFAIGLPEGVLKVLNKLPESYLYLINHTKKEIYKIQVFN